MELKLVYRTLRKISDWTVTGYYSECLVEGQENVPENGPLIIASTHHNEIIDIATLAATIPHRRHLSFWAKSTMFANPITGAILSSSGAIPVKRNPNSSASIAAASATASSSKGKAEEDLSATRSGLFRETSNTLAANQVVGVFPEGTSYTHSKILQTMPGAAWAAVEYARSVRGRRISGQEEEGYAGKGKAKAKPEQTNLRIIPVAVVYTDKAKYLSRIYVQYGEPIMVDSYLDELFDEASDIDASSRAVVKKIMGEVESRMVEMTINAPNWDTICSVKAARSILWGDEDNVPLEDWVEINQSLVEMLSSPVERPLEVETALARYYALLHHTNIKHAVLTSLIPNDAYNQNFSAKSFLYQPTLSLLLNCPVTILRFIAFLPPLALFLPGYISGQLTAKLLAKKDEEEAQAQFKAIGGGIGMGLSAALILGVLSRFDKLAWLRAAFQTGGMDLSSRVKELIGTIGSVYFGVVLLIKWHNCLVKANYRQLQRLTTYFTLCSALLLRRRILDPARLLPFTKPPLPVVNAFVKKTSAESSVDSSATNSPVKPPSPRRLMRHLLDARADASASLSAHLQKAENEALLNYFVGKGAKLPPCRNI